MRLLRCLTLYLKGMTNAKIKMGWDGEVLEVKVTSLRLSITAALGSPILDLGCGEADHVTYYQIMLKFGNMFIFLSFIF